jgi:hypothetical protein
MRLVALITLLSFSTACAANDFRPRVPQVASADADPATPLGDDGTTTTHASNKKDIWSTEHRTPTAAIVGLVVFGLVVVVGAIATGVALSNGHVSGGGGYGASPNNSGWGGYWGGSWGHF